MATSEDRSMSDEALLQKKDCPICLGEGCRLYRVRTIDSERERFVGVRSCGNCGHRWIDPTPTQDRLNDLYAAAAREVMDPAWLPALQQKRLSNAEREVLRLAKRASTRDRLAARYLEIGVGGGKLYDEVVRAGLRAHGVEPGGWGKRPGVVDNVGSLGPLEFDLIACIDVLEHMEDPAGFVASLKRRAAPSAMLICRFPAGDSMEARIRGQRWGMILPFAHLHFFSKRSAELMLSRAGWSVKRVRRVGWTGCTDALRPAGGLRKLCELLGLGDQLLVSAEARA